jgi:hypothetical protein
MDSHPLPDEQVPFFRDDYLDAKRDRESSLDLVGFLDHDDSILALAMSGSIWALIGDQMRLGALFLSQLQPSMPGVEVGIALDEYTLGLGAKGHACR